jgi:hypothetical protein
MRLFRTFRVLLLAAMLATASLAFATGSVLAYGKADQPLAQIEISGNCNDPSFPFCSQVHVGGIWVWIEIDAGGTGDWTGSVCEHTVGGPNDGATPLRGEISWHYASAATSDRPVLPGFTDPTDTYYDINLFEFAVPVAQGHYATHDVPGVNTTIEVAP